MISALLQNLVKLYEKCAETGRRNTRGIKGLSTQFSWCGAEIDSAHWRLLDIDATCSDTRVTRRQGDDTRTCRVVHLFS